MYLATKLISKRLRISILGFVLVLCCCFFCWTPPRQEKPSGKVKDKQEREKEEDFHKRKRRTIRALLLPTAPIAPFLPPPSPLPSPTIPRLFVIALGHATHVRTSLHSSAPRAPPPSFLALPYTACVLYLSFFLMRRWLVWPHFFFRQFLARGGRRA